LQITAPKAQYQKRENTGAAKREPTGDGAASSSLSRADHDVLIAECRQHGIGFFSTAFDSKASNAADLGLVASSKFTLRRDHQCPSCDTSQQLRKARSFFPPSMAKHGLKSKPPSVHRARRERPRGGGQHNGTCIATTEYRSPRPKGEHCGAMQEHAWRPLVSRGGLLRKHDKA